MDQEMTSHALGELASSRRKLLHMQQRADGWMWMTSWSKCWTF